MIKDIKILINTFIDEELIIDHIIHYFALYVAPVLVYLLYLNFEIDLGINSDFDLFYKKTVIISSSLIILYYIFKYLLKFLFFTQSGKIVFYIIVIIFFIINND